MDREGSNDRELPEGVINADPPGGWESVDDTESRERSEEAVGLLRPRHQIGRSRPGLCC